MIESNSKTIQHSCFPSPSILDLTSPRYHRPMHVHWPSGKRITCNKMTDRSSFFSTHGDKRSQNKVEDGPRDPTKLGNALWTQKCGTNFCKQKNWDIPSCIPVNYPHSIVVVTQVIVASGTELIIGINRNVGVDNLD